MGWQNRLPGCFGTKDGKFACHQNEVERAAELLLELVLKKVSWTEVKKEIETYLGSRGSPPDHVKREVKRARKHMKRWLY